MKEAIEEEPKDGFCYRCKEWDPKCKNKRKYYDAPCEQYEERKNDGQEASL